MLAGADYETYSEAGYTFDGRRWRPARKGAKSGLDLVGAWIYSRHYSTVVTTFVYDLKNGDGRRLWYPGLPNPVDLFAHVAAGRLLEAYNSFFEWCIWNNVCVRLYGWPPIPLYQTRDVMAKASAWTINGGLDVATKVLQTPIQKDAAGKRVMRKISKPRSPSKLDARQKFLRHEHPEDFARLDLYCETDVQSEDEVSIRCADLSEFETQVFLVDQAINARGVHVDTEAVYHAQAIIEQATTKYNAEVHTLTGGAAATADKVPAIKAWLATQGIQSAEASLDKDAVDVLLDTPRVTGAPRRVLEIRKKLGAKSVQKCYSIGLRADTDNRVRDLFAYCGAGRTWRFAGRGPQPQNLPTDGPKVKRCACGSYRGAHLWFCPDCFGTNASDTDWCIEAAEQCLRAIATRDLGTVETIWGDALTAVSGCLRAMFCAAPGFDFISSDYSAIEAVVLAMLAGEMWRVEVFRTHGKIYEACQSRITGVPLGELLDYRERTGSHHPQRKQFGKIPELASGYGGWVKAWLNFGAGEYMSEDEIKKNVIKWREASPGIVAFWPGVENAAIAAVNDPSQAYTYRDISYRMWGNALYCHLPSGRAIPYLEPEISYGTRHGKPNTSLSYAGLVKKQWVRIHTWGGMLTENIAQALSRDVFAAAMVRLEANAYPIVLHSHDEPVSEVPEGFGSIVEYESIMNAFDPWCAAYPIKASGGWRGKRYRKD